MVYSIMACDIYANINHKQDENGVVIQHKDMNRCVEYNISLESILAVIC